MNTQGVEFVGPGTYTFNVPVGVTVGWVDMTGGGGGHSGTSSGIGGGSGSDAELVIGLPVLLPSGGTVAVVVATGGIGGDAAGGRVLVTWADP